MNKISCDICVDLIPLVQDGVATEDSRKAVEEHIAHCDVCRARYNGKPQVEINPEQLFCQLRKKMKIIGLFLMMMGVFVGLSFTAGENLFYNLLIMPLIGALGYGVFRNKAIYEIPILLFITHLVLNTINWAKKIEVLEFSSLLAWTAVYALLALVGALIAMLFHYAFKKEKNI